VAEMRPKLVHLLPDLRLGFQEVEQVSRGDSEGFRGLADPRFPGEDHVEHHPNRGPETRVLAPDVEPARPVLRQGHLLAGRQLLAGALVADLQIERLAQPLERPGAILMLGAALLGDDDEPAGQMPQPHGGAGLVALLPPRPAGAIGVHLALREQLGVGQGRPGCTHIVGKPNHRVKEITQRKRPLAISHWPFAICHWSMLNGEWQMADGKWFLSSLCATSVLSVTLWLAPFRSSRLQLPRGAHL